MKMYYSIVLFQMWKTAKLSDKHKCASRLWNELPIKHTLTCSMWRLDLILSPPVKPSHFCPADSDLENWPTSAGTESSWCKDSNKHTYSTVSLERQQQQQMREEEELDRCRWRKLQFYCWATNFLPPDITFHPFLTLSLSLSFCKTHTHTQAYTDLV